MLLSSAALGPPALERKATAARKPALALAIRMPCALTSAGSRGTASVTRFCVCTAAMSALVPVSNVSVI